MTDEQWENDRERRFDISMQTDKEFLAAQIEMLRDDIREFKIEITKLEVK